MDEEAYSVLTFMSKNIFLFNNTVQILYFVGRITVKGNSGFLWLKTLFLIRITIFNKFKDFK